MKTPVEAFLDKVNRMPEASYLHQPVAGRWHVYTFQQAADEVKRMAAYLHSLNLPRGSRIGIVSKNCAHWILADLAIMFSGHVSVPMYPNIQAKTLRYILEHSEAKVLFIGKLDDWNALKPGIPGNVHCISFPFYGPKEGVTWEYILAHTEPLPEYHPITADELLTIVYTSGTTGNPKGVMLYCKNLSYAIENALSVINPGNQRHRLFSYLPLSHIAERMIVEANSLWLGTEVYFAESLDLFLDNLRYARPTVFLGVPRIWVKFQMGILEKLPQRKLDRLLAIPLIGALVRKKIKKQLGLDKTLYFYSGAAPIPVSILNWYDRLGIRILEVYAMTENCAYSHLTRSDKVKFGYAGQPLPGVEVKVTEHGELLVKSEATMAGYYKEPELTAQVLKDGWLHTGDTAVVDPEGFVKITGRIKEIFKTEKGKYVAPAPIEMHVLKNQLIEQVCVIGSGLPQPIALAVLSEGGRKQAGQMVEASLCSTLKEVNASLESHERLKKIVVVKEAWTVENNALTPSMKIRRAVVEERYRDKIPEWYNNDAEVVWEQ